MMSSTRSVATGGLVLAALVAACGPTPRSESGVDAKSPPKLDANNTQWPDGDNNTNDAYTFIYAHTANALFKVDPSTLAITKIGQFTFTTGDEQITDIAINKSGVMIGISFTSVYRIDTMNAAATRLSLGLTGQFNGLSFVPASEIGQTGDDVLVATRNANGFVFRIDPNTGATTQIGNMNGYVSSGDVVSVAQLGTLQTADSGAASNLPDRLVRLAPGTFTATTIGTSIGFDNIWGVAYWNDKMFGFTNAGEFITINPTTGVGTLVEANGPRWWGAAVTTIAPVIL